ncbi:MAG: hypothetical protein JNK07_04455 [Alphaproteobacteria bacterium]|nr:hypothetical protein [Alphaproteobacteria bacterium]
MSFDHIDRLGPEKLIELYESFLSKATRALVAHVQVDPDLDPLRDHPNFKAMVAAVELRLAAEEARAKS